MSMIGKLPYPGRVSPTPNTLWREPSERRWSRGSRLWRFRKVGTRAFTLMELMIVVVIISIFATLAIPMVVKSRNERLAYEDAGAIMQLFQKARARAIGRGTAVVVAMTANGTADRGTFRVYEALNLGQSATTVPATSCKLPTDWQTYLTQSPAPKPIMGVNLNGPLDTSLGIQTAASVGGTLSDTTFTGGYVCIAPSGRLTFLRDDTMSQPVRFDALLPMTAPLVFTVTKTSGSGIQRSVLVPPNGHARLISR